MSDDLKARVLEAFCQRSKGEKKMFYIRDVVKWFPDEDRHAVQDAVKALIDEDAVKYWSSGSTTYLVLAECYPKES
ncbi:MAG TPA: dissimilatory sulfite reductase D family protein [Syntrophales bacterium]|nr:dissimilatory sulfite reductase D family protein [Syntrophales bacterium]